jgi:hypothetical protein
MTATVRLCPPSCPTTRRCAPAGEPRNGSPSRARRRIALERELDDRPELVALNRRTIIPGESMLQTVLQHSDAIRTTQPNLTFGRQSDMDGADADDLALGEVDEIVHSGRAFARKMHPQRSAALRTS